MTVRQEIEVDAPVERVFEHFVDAEKLVRWIGIAADLDPVPGGRFRFEIVPGQWCEGEYVEVDPPTHVVMTWGWTEPTMQVPPGSSRVTVDLSPTPAGGTLVSLVHDGLPDAMAPMHDHGWTGFLQRLATEAA